MLICADCGRVFDSPRRIVERHGQDTPPYEQYDACPGCSGTDLHTARNCDLCGNWITGDYIRTADGQNICEDCYTIHGIEDD